VFLVWKDVIILFSAAIAALHVKMPTGGSVGRWLVCLLVGRSVGMRQRAELSSRSHVSTDFFYFACLVW
jgi:hypothetical protein